MTVATASTQIGQAWTSLGTGPLLLQAVEGAVYLQIAASQPAAGPAGFLLRPEYGPKDFNTTSTLWAYAAAPGDATVIAAPVTA